MTLQYFTATKLKQLHWNIETKMLVEESSAYQTVPDNLVTWPKTQSNFRFECPLHTYEIK